MQVGIIHLVRTQNFSKNLCAYQGVRNVSSSGNFAYVLNEWYRSCWCDASEVHLESIQASKMELFAKAFNSQKRSEYASMHWCGIKLISILIMETSF